MNSDSKPYADIPPEAKGISDEIRKLLEVLRDWDCLSQRDVTDLESSVKARVERHIEVREYAGRTK